MGDMCLLAQRVVPENGNTDLDIIDSYVAL